LIVHECTAHAIANHLYPVTLEINVNCLSDNEVRRFIKDNELDREHEYNVIGNLCDDIVDWLCSPTYSDEYSPKPLDKYLDVRLDTTDFDYDPRDGMPLLAYTTPSEFLRLQRSLGNKFFDIVIEMPITDVPEQFHHPCLDNITIELLQPHFALSEYAKTMLGSSDALVKEWR
jgi:hypothetical protein